jgi:hypothetical protein
MAVTVFSERRAGPTAHKAGRETISCRDHCLPISVEQRMNTEMPIRLTEESCMHNFEGDVTQMSLPQL